jgi:uncharacterized protein
MIIHLNEIPDDGKSFSFSRKSGELNSILADLLGTQDYKVEFLIRPLSQGFELVGSTSACIPELCSRCGIDIKLPLNSKFKELMLPKLELDRTAKYTKQNHMTDSEHLTDTPSVVEYEGNIFDVGAYIHEVLGLMIPTCPAAPVDENGTCTVCGVDTTKENAFSYNEELPEDKANSPFAALKSVKLN